MTRDFPGGPVVKNLPSNAGDVGLIPGRGTKIPQAVGQLSPWATTTVPASHNYWAREPQLLSPRATTTEPTCLEPVLRNKRSHHNEKPVHRNKE